MIKFQCHYLRSRIMTNYLIIYWSIEKVNAHFYFLSDVYVRLVLQVHLVLHEFIHFVRLILQTERLLLQKMHLVLQRVRLLLQ